MNSSTILKLSTSVLLLSIASCKRSNKNEAESNPEMNADAQASVSEQSKREQLFKLMPKENLTRLGVQTSRTLGGMNTPKEEFSSYPFTLGPTGITAQRSGNGYTVSAVSEDSPADGKLKAGDYIVGANGRKFTVDKDKFPEATRRFPNPQMGIAIEHAEANGGTLSLMLSNTKPSAKPENEVIKTVEIQLQAIGEMGANFPTKSLKSEFLAARQSEIILAHQNASGGWGTGLVKNGKTQSKSKLIPTSMCALALMSTGDSKYEPAIKKALEAMLDTKVKSFHTWNYAYKAAFLTEYHFRYGDPRIKPAMQEMVNNLADGYFYYNGVYGYGHGLNGGNYRYAGINVCTAHACYVLAMGRILDCTMPNNIDVLMAKSLERLAPDGALDYTWGARAKGETPSKRNEDQGRTGTAAVAYYYLGGRPEHYEKFVAYLFKNKEHADGGHATGGTLSWAASGLGLASADDARFNQYMQSKVWQFAFNRSWNHGYVLQPSPHGQHRGSDQALGVHYVTAANTILFNRHKKNLIMTGLKKGIPTVKPSYRTEVLAASDYYERQGKIVDIVRAINIMKSKTPASVIAHLEQLKSIPIESAEYHQKISAFYAKSLPNVMRSVANTALTEEQRNQALSALLGINYSRGLKISRNKLSLSQLFTPPNHGSAEIITKASNETNTKTYKIKTKAVADFKVKKQSSRTPFTIDQDIDFHTKILWNGIQIDIPYSHKKEDSKYLSIKEGIRGTWSKKPWDVSYGPIYGTIKRTKTNGCLQIIFPDGTIFETALMNTALIHAKGKSDTLNTYLKKSRQKNIPDGTKVQFSYFHRGGKPSLPMCDEITILE